MQHLDEGTIHSWLDGALAPDEAAQVEAHVAECPECAAAVAEARGFIAASSRILTALDNAPRGVIPVAAPNRRVDPIVWRVAATLLVVAAGTLAVFRNGGREAATSSASADTSATTITAAAPAVPGPDETAKTTAETAPPITRSENPPRNTAIAGTQPTGKPTEKSMERRRATDAVGATKQTLAAAPPSVSDLVKERATAPQPNMPARENAAAGQVSGVTAGQISPSSAYVNAEPAPPRILIRGSSSLLTARDSVTAVAPLRIVGTRRQIGARITLYEVAPNDTVTLTELMSTQLEAVVSGMPTVPQEGRAAKSSAAAPPQRADAAVAMQDSQREAGAAAAPPRVLLAPAPVTGIETANGVTTITWTDATTGGVLKLSGRIPAAQLQQIKIRIEQERAAAAAAARRKP
ncbi:MAG: zf-HC2 domain-containing protein [Gemmatimonadota bacterium]|nr:zf-HC2 domain-containing protein [Gemmatimonadota bacterium]